MLVSREEYCITEWRRSPNGGATSGGWIAEDPLSLRLCFVCHTSYMI